MKTFKINLYLFIFLIFSISTFNEVEQTAYRILASDSTAYTCLELVRSLVNEKLSLEERRAILIKPKVLKFLENVDIEFKEIFKDSNNTFYVTRYIYGDDPVVNKNEYYLEFENSIMKTMNDKFFLDKNISFSINKYFRTLLWNNIQKAMSENQMGTDNYLKLVDTYLDWKSLRLVVNTTDDAAMHQIINYAYQETIRDFKAKMIALDFNKLAIGFGEDLEDPAFWFLSGMGTSPWKAYLSARRARKIFKKQRIHIPSIIRYSAAEEGYENTVEFISKEVSHIDKLQTEIGNYPNLIEKGIIQHYKSTDRFIFSVETMDIFRKAQGQINEINVGIANLFQYRLTDEEYKILMRYFEKIEFFAPPVFVEKQIDDWHFENIKDVGAVSFDFRQIGASVLVDLQNDFVRLVLDASFKSGEELSEEMLALIKDRGLNASKMVDELNKAFTENQKEIFGSGKSGVAEVISSGDEGIFYPSAVLTRAKQEEFVSLLAQQKPGKFRFVFLPPTFLGGAHIPDNLVASLISDGESLEKEIRKKVAGFIKGKIHPKKFNQITMAIRINPAKSADGPFSTTYDLLIHGSKNVLTQNEIDLITKAYHQIIERDLLKKGARHGKVIILNAQNTLYFQYLCYSRASLQAA